MILFLYISVGYLAFTSLILWMNTRDFKPLLLSSHKSNSEDLPLVSICIPARNEENVIKRLVQSLVQQNYPNFEVLILNDESTDCTQEILSTLKNEHPEIIKITKGKPKPDSWLGKSWACHQLSKKAYGDLLLFLDADAWLEPDAVHRLVISMQFHDVEFATLWPLQKLGSFWEKAVIPIVYYGLLSLLPAKYVHQKPGWLPSSLEGQFAHRFAAACGQCMAFTKKAYESIGGHQSVKDEIVEDVALAKQIKRHGYRMHMYHGEGSVHCRMYTSGKEMWQGFRKNFLALYNYSIPAFSLMAVLNFIVYVLPFISLPILIISNNTTAIVLCATAIALMYLHRLILSIWFHWSPSFLLTHPLGILWFHVLGIRVLTDYIKGRPVRWKDREL